MSNRGIYLKLINLFSLLLTVLFVYTAASKLMHLDTFQTRLERMPFISGYAHLISWIVPFLEFVIAGLLWFQKYRKVALYGSLILLGVFTTYILVVLIYSDSIPCTCGGIISTLGWRDHILFNTAFMLMSLLGIIWSNKHYNIQAHQNTT